MWKNPNNVVVYMDTNKFYVKLIIIQRYLVNIMGKIYNYIFKSKNFQKEESFLLKANGCLKPWVLKWPSLFCLFFIFKMGLQINLLIGFLIDCNWAIEKFGLRGMGTLSQFIHLGIWLKSSNPNSKEIILSPSLPLSLPCWVDYYCVENMNWNWILI